GFARDLDELATTVRMIVDVGAVGIHLEDTAHDPEHALLDGPSAIERVRVAREAADRAGLRLVITARTDVYRLGVGGADDRFITAVARATAFLTAGADCVFVPFVRDTLTIAALAREIRGPLNVLAGAGSPSLAELARLGVARVSVG